jgi:hypothetical protein
MWLLIWFLIWSVYMATGAWICAAARRVEHAEQTSNKVEPPYEHVEQESPL